MALFLRKDILMSIGPCNGERLKWYKNCVNNNYTVYYQEHLQISSTELYMSCFFMKVFKDV
jgi:hypothetical protein